VSYQRHGGDRRGGSVDRRNRKLWMLRTWGNGQTVRCVHCKTVLCYATVEADRIIPGGSYRHENVQPSCGPCNKARGPGRFA
jgi:hypothetical protein